MPRRRSFQSTIIYGRKSWQETGETRLKNLPVHTRKTRKTVLKLIQIEFLGKFGMVKTTVTIEQ
jgi:hypothetical protein